MAVISNLSVSLTANTKGITKGLNKAKRQLKSFTKNVFSVKSAIVGALGIGGVGAILGSSLSAWREQEQAVASLEAANKSMGRTTVGITDDMIKLAAQLQREGIIGDEAIIQGQSFLSTYSQIPDELLPRATRAMVDLMAKTGGSGQNAANMIGKAAMGMAGALKIAGITLSDDTLKAIKLDNEMKKMADKAGINLRGLTDKGKTFKLILRDIESQIGGTNKALAKTDTGAFDQLANSVGDLRELIGKVVASGLGKWVRQLSQDIDNQKLSVDGLAISFKKWVTESILNIAPLVESFKGIQLVIKTMKLGFMGFGALVTGTFRNLAERVKTFGDVFGLDIGEAAFAKLDESYNNQIKNLKVAQNEIATLAGDISNQTFSKNLERKLKEFDKRATITADKLTKPTVSPAKIQGSLDKLVINPEKDNQRVIIDKSAQLDTTNDLLSRINNNINKQRVAVAG